MIKILEDPPLHFHGYLRDGRIIRECLPLKPAGFYSHYPLYEAPPCPHCHSTFGIMIQRENSIFFCCIGISCLLKSINYF